MNEEKPKSNQRKAFFFINYLKRGSTYASYFSEVVNLTLLSFNFVVIAYLGFHSTLQNLAVFAAVFISVFMGAFILFGWWDWKRGTLPAEQILSWQFNPVWRDFQEAFYLHLEGKDSEAKKLMEKWVKSDKDGNKI